MQSLWKLTEKAKYGFDWKYNSEWEGSVLTRKSNLLLQFAISFGNQCSYVKCIVKRIKYEISNNKYLFDSLTGVEKRWWTVPASA